MDTKTRTLLLSCMLCLPWLTHAETQRPALHGQHWMAITGKPLAATTGAMMFQKGGNAVDSAAAMLAATATMWDVLSWGGETQALIYHPGKKESLASMHWGLPPRAPRPGFSRNRVTNTHQTPDPWQR